MSPSFPRILLLCVLTGACVQGDGLIDPGDATPSRAFGIWQPGAHDGCTKAQHDTHAVIGPDGKAYPTWHPPTGPGGCGFGHEHGRDPSGSDLYQSLDGVPFGFANEMLAVSDPANPRDEDHVGHKIEWENDVVLPVLSGGSGSATAVCDILYKIHQGTHSKDAFTNNLHELAYHLSCTDGTEVHVTMLSAIGPPGQYTRACNPTESFTVGQATPANSPAGFGSRRIPDRTCVEEHMLVPAEQQSDYEAALQESWYTYNRVRRSDGRTLVFFDPYFQVRLPSRFYDPRLPSALGRPVDACYEALPNGERASGGACATSTGDGAAADVTWDDPRSMFKGSARLVLLNITELANADGPEVWYTDALGMNGRPEPFRGSIRQTIAPIDRDLGVQTGGPSIGGSRDYGGAGVRAPN